MHPNEALHLLPRWCRATGLVGQLVLVAAATIAASTVWGQTESTIQFPAGIDVHTEPLPRPLPDVNAAGELTLDELEQRALAMNPSLRRLNALVSAARGNSLQVGLPPNPSIGYEGQQLGSGGLAEQHGVLFSQEIVRGGKLRLNRAVANREQMRLEQELAAQQMRVQTDVRIAYYEVLLAQRQIDLTDNLIRIGSEGSESVDALFKAKELGRADVLQAQLETENARILSENARNRYTAAWQGLTAVVGDESLESQPLRGDLLGPVKELDFQRSLDRLLQQSPEISAAAMEVERARLTLDRARVEPVPNVTVQGIVNWQDNGIGGKPDGGVAVTIPVPLFNRNQGAIARASQEYVAAREALAQRELELKNRLAPVYEQYANARNQFNRYQEIILPAAQESLDLTRNMYSAGETGYTTLLTAQRTYSQTQLNYLDTIRALRIAEAQIEGLLLSGSLSSSPMVENVGSASERVSLPTGGVELFGR